jgi:hypothetical protein
VRSIGLLSGTVFKVATTRRRRFENVLAPYGTIQRSPNLKVTSALYKVSNQELRSFEGSLQSDKWIRS